MNRKNGVEGYKVFYSDWTCRDFQYKVGETYTMEEKPICCERGFHFCKNLANCFNYYLFDPANKVAKVLALGDIDEQDLKLATNKICILEEITWEEVLELVNTGKNNRGLGNTGENNIGEYNIGNNNCGFANHGDNNKGSLNLGDNNKGSCNLGNYNKGYHNIGDFNKSNGNCGCFNTISNEKMKFFNKESDMTYEQWEFSTEKCILESMPYRPKLKNNILVSGEYIDEYNKKQLKLARQDWWDNLPCNTKDTIKALPNFDADIFEKCTGIKVD